MRIFLIGGSPEAQPPTRLAPAPGELVIAADHGAAHARAWGWPLHLLVGDLDSLGADEAALVVASGVPVITAPAAKDETDLELALAHALARGASEIIICAALGGRADHLLANVLLLARPELADLAVTLVDGRESIRLLRGGAAAAGASGAAGSAGRSAVPAPAGLRRRRCYDRGVAVSFARRDPVPGTGTRRQQSVHVGASGHHPALRLAVGDPYHR